MKMDVKKLELHFRQENDGTHVKVVLFEEDGDVTVVCDTLCDAEVIRINFVPTAQTPNKEVN